MKRKTIIIDDSEHEKLHSGKYGEYLSHKFSSEEGLYDDHIDLELGKNVWNSFGKPNKVKVTITVVE